MMKRLLVVLMIVGTALAAGTGELTWRLWGQVEKDAGNVFFSPASVNSALAIAAQGAKGKTAEELRVVAPLAEQDALWQELEKVAASHGERLDVANGVWVQKGRKLLVGGLTGELDFHQSPGQAIRAINEWVSAHTEKLIPDLLHDGDVTSETRLVLANAIYFKGVWKLKFDEHRTMQETFQAASPVKVPMMHHGTSTFGYAEMDGGQVLELPYQDGRLSMVIYLPAVGKPFPGLSAETLTNWSTHLRDTELDDVILPRFKMRWHKDLVPLLVRAGLPTAMSEGADFTGLDGTHEVISGVVHEATVTVDEQGSEAAAATGVIMRPATAVVPPHRPIIFRADHPFIFLIRDRQTGTVLFMGRLSKP